MKILAFSNHKGGVGKTTSVINIGAGLSKQGYKVLLIDLDAQANLSQSLGVDEPELNIYGVFKSLYPVTKAIMQVSGEQGLYLLPSTLDLSGIEMELITEIGREYRLKEIIAPVVNDYNYILIDCPPSLSILTINALTVADEVYIPLQAEYLAMQGIKRLFTAIEMVRGKVNDRLNIGGVFITQYSKRKVLNRNVDNTLTTLFKDKALNTKIRENIALAESPANFTHIFNYAPNSTGAEDYLELTKEIILKHKNT